MYFTCYSFFVVPSNTSREICLLYISFLLHILCDETSWFVWLNYLLMYRYHIISKQIWRTIPKGYWTYEWNVLYIKIHLKECFKHSIWWLVCYLPFTSLLFWKCIWLPKSACILLCTLVYLSKLKLDTWNLMILNIIQTLNQCWKHWAAYQIS